MKKVLLLSLLLLVCVSVSFSQFGIKGGLNLGTAGGDDKSINPGMFDASLASLPSVEPKARTGFTAGLSYKAGFLPILGLQTEVLYTQKGAVYEVAVPAALGGGSGKATFKLDYIDIPILLKITPLPLPVVTPYLEAGASYSILLGAKLKLEDPAGESDEGDIKDGMTKGDLSIIVGVGVEILMLDINARYVMGQTKVFKDGDVKIFNRGIMVTAGIRF
jgi:hypothetical protein